jgi:hypothetical protein
MKPASQRNDDGPFLGPAILLQEYLKAVDLLTINEENRLRIKVVDLQKQADRFTRMEEKLKAVVDKLGLDI